MYTYIFGIIAAFLAAILHSGCNVIDSYLSNKLFKRLSSLIFAYGLTGLVFIPFIAIFSFPKILNLSQFAIIFIIALIEVLYSYPYYWSFRHSDTSIVASLFSLGKIVVPIFAFVFIGERLSVTSYIGFGIIVLSSFLLTFNIKKLKFNKAFYLMLLVSIFLGIQSILYKYLFENGVGFGSAVIWTLIFSFIISGFVILYPSNFLDFKNSLKKIKSIKGWFIFNRCLDWAGELCNSLAIFLIPVSIVKGITSSQPIFVLILALVLSRKIPLLFKEYIGKDGLIKKIILFLIIILGTILITG